MWIQDSQCWNPVRLTGYYAVFIICLVVLEHLFLFFKVPSGGIAGSTVWMVEEALLMVGGRGFTDLLVLED